MIPVKRVPEPADFDARARRPGQQSLERNPAPRRPRDYWSPFKGILADGFGHRCGYTAMYEPVGSIDHFVSCKNDPRLAYEWANYRFAQEWINKSKQTLDGSVLDPYEIEDGWFEIILPSLQLRVTDDVPPSHRPRAEFTLTRLRLRDDERVLRQRREWLRMYETGEIDLAGLHKKAPLIAAAVEKERTSPPQTAAR
jgi:hypothetical protein